MQKEGLLRILISVLVIPPEYQRIPPSLSFNAKYIHWSLKDPAVAEGTK